MRLAVSTVGFVSRSAHRVTWTLAPSTGHHPREEVVDGRKTFVDGPACFYWFGTVGLEDETYELGLHHPATTVVMKRRGWVSCAASILPKALLPSFWEYHGERVAIHLVESLRVAVKTLREERVTLCAFNAKEQGYGKIEPP